MAFGLPGTETTNNGQFLSRIQFHALSGFWTVVKRAQQSDGSWADQHMDPVRTPQFLMNFADLEIGYIKFASPPAFVLAPYGAPIPTQPEEMTPGAPGEKPRKAFQPGFRIKVASQKTFGDGEAYYFSHTAKTVLDPMDELHQRYLRAPEAAQGLLPLVGVTGTRPVEVKTPRGVNRFHAPVFEILSWHARPECFGEAMGAPPPAAPRSYGAPSSDAPMMAMGGTTGTAPKAAAVPSEMPFGPEVR